MGLLHRQERPELVGQLSRAGAGAGERTGGAQLGFNRTPGGDLDGRDETDEVSGEGVGGKPIPGLLAYPDPSL